MDPTEKNRLKQKSVVGQSLNHVWLFVTPWTAARQVPLSSTISQRLFKFMSTELVMLSNHLILYCPFFLLLSIFPSISVFSNESVLCIRWSKFSSFSFNISPSNEHPGLISFRMDWLDLRTFRKILWRWAWQPTTEFLPGESHRQRSLTGYSPRGHKELEMSEVTLAHMRAHFA